MENLSAADVAAVTHTGYGYSGDGFGFGSGSGIWLFAILALMWGGFGGNRFGNNAMENRYATPEDIQNASNFAALERQMNEGVAATRQGVYDVTGAVKDANYNTLGEIRDLQAAVAAGNAQGQQSCCNILRAIDSVNYNQAINTASINANTTAGIQKVLDRLCEDKASAQAARISQLELQQALSGVVRYPTNAAYAIGTPFNVGYGCGSTNI